MPRSAIRLGAKASLLLLLTVWPAATAAVTQAETAVAAKRPLRVMIAGAPAAGKGTQCEQIVKKVCRTV
jgi:pantothenate kinase